jgi:hypothetical protein
MTIAANRKRKPGSIERISALAGNSAKALSLDGNAVITNLAAFATYRAPQRIRLDRDYRKGRLAAGKKWRLKGRAGFRVAFLRG